MNWSDIMKTCPNCGKECLVYGYEDFCSYQCQRDAVRECKVCYRPFSRKEIAYLYTCSDECNKVETRRFIYKPKECKVCGIELSYDHPLTDFYTAEVFYACSKQCKDTYFYENKSNRQAWKS